MLTKKRCLLSAFSLLALAATAGPSEAAGGSLTDYVCYSTPTEVKTAPVGVGVTTAASVTATVGCSPAVQNGVRGFLMTATWAGSVQGKGPFGYGTDCGGDFPGPGASACSGGAGTWFCPAPGTSPCSATASGSVSVWNQALSIDRASASDSRSITCRYLA